MELHLTLSPEQEAHLRATAEKDGISIQQAAIIGIEVYATNCEQRLAEVIARVISKNDELLTRLSD